MEKFIQYWEHIPSAHRIIVLLGGMLLFWLAEGYYPLFRFSYKRYRHAGVNLLFLVTTIVLNLLFGLVTIWSCHFVTMHHWGIINWLPLPAWASNNNRIIAGRFVWPVYPPLYNAQNKMDVEISYDTP